MLRKIHLLSLGSVQGNSPWQAVAQVLFLWHCRKAGVFVAAFWWALASQQHGDGSVEQP